MQDQIKLSFQESAQQALKQVGTQLVQDLYASGFSPCNVKGEVTIHGTQWCLDELRDSVSGNESLVHAVNEMKDKIRLVNRHGASDVIFPTPRLFQFVFTSF